MTGRVLAPAAAPPTPRARGVAMDLAMMLTDGGEAIAGLAVCAVSRNLRPGSLGRQRVAGPGRHRHRSPDPYPHRAGTGARSSAWAQPAETRPADFINGRITIPPIGASLGQDCR